MNPELTQAPRPRPLPLWVDAASVATERPPPALLLTMTRSSSFFLPEVSTAEFERYLAGLRHLVDQPSPFTAPDTVTAIMDTVHRRMTRSLPSYRHNRDAAGNLICVPAEIIASAPILYLSAHVDTVPANPSIWTSPFAPHPAFEDEHQLVAQGVNDCKAGVATQLWLAELAACGALDLQNIVFTFTFKEEGSGPKTGTALGEAFGSDLPAPTPGSTLLVLENTIRSDAPYVPLVYAAENSSYTIRLTGPLVALRAAQLALAQWRPVAITPIVAPLSEWMWTDHPPQGHVCTAPPEKTLSSPPSSPRTAPPCLVPATNAPTAPFPRTSASPLVPRPMRPIVSRSPNAATFRSLQPSPSSHPTTTPRSSPSPNPWALTSPDAAHHPPSARPFSPPPTPARSPLIATPAHPTPPSSPRRSPRLIGRFCCRLSVAREPVPNARRCPPGLPTARMRLL